MLKTLEDYPSDVSREEIKERISDLYAHELDELVIMQEKLKEFYKTETYIQSQRNFTLGYCSLLIL